MYKVDMNSDLGESFGAWKMGMDKEIIGVVTSVNAACGWHAGDPVVMENTVKLCKEFGVAVGAHPGYPDLMGFGRRTMKMSFEETKAGMKYQIGALMAFTKSQGIKMQHVKVHGMMANDSVKDEKLARAMCEAIYEVDKDLIMLTFSNCLPIQIAKEIGLRTAGEIFADRAYNDDYSLVSRGTPGALIHDPDLAAKRVVRMIKEGKVETVTGKTLDISADSVCVHSDTPTAVQIVKNLRAALEAEGIVLCNIAEVIG